MIQGYENYKSLIAKPTFKQSSNWIKKMKEDGTKFSNCSTYGGFSHMQVIEVKEQNEVLVRQPKINHW